MKNIIYLILTVLLISNISAIAQTETSIITLRENNSQGEPLHMDETFTVSGVVTSSNQFGASGPSTLQDNTAGISVYGSGFAGTVNIGDSVSITSTITHYNGLTQFDFSSTGSTVNVLKSGLTVEPKIVTLNQIATQAWNGVEELEGMLVRVNSVTINANGSFEGNTNYSVSDASGNLELRIDKDVTSLVGVTIPSAAVDIIGIVGQYDRDAPYSSGYQLLPRSIDDIVTESEPLIISPVIAADITTNSFTVYFSTVREGNTQVHYGKTSGLELGKLIINESTKNHKLVINNLEPVTTYYYKAVSSNANGISESKIQTVSTASDDTTIGTINVYFNHSVDNSVAIQGNEAAGNVNFSSKLIERINNATYSIDMALYSFTGLSNVANAIISAKNNRGVKVRVVYHNRTMQSSMQMLADAGIKISQRPTTDGLMHNKFAIFDGRDDNTRNDWVWTGSWNWTNFDNRNNVVEINSPALAEAYTKEFEEMWGSNDDNPNSSAAKFGADKTDNTTHSFNIGGRQIDLFFSPSDGTESHITNAITTADTSIYFSILSFTSDPIFNTINSRHNAGVNDIRGIIDNVDDTGSEFTNLQPISEVFDYNLNGLFHHKYSIIDSYSPSSEPIVITGSHNWSRAANTKNDENTLIIHDVYIANKYMQEFKARYNELGGSNGFTVPVITSVDNEKTITGKFELYQNYPNPFNPVTTIKYSIPLNVVVTHESPLQYVLLKIYNILGKEVTTLVNRKQKPGSYQVSFKASGLPSGVYFYKLKAGSFNSVRKMILVK
jgi:phosphatidylserine/phosphatidylglycerophosphate/cardiolipin synthase-like enzyme